jgi:hypothetical protein
MTWFVKAAEQGSLRAEAHVGDLYREGLGVSQDYKTALSWYLKASPDPRLTMAPYWIGHIYERGGFGVERDYVQAMHWYQIAANNGEPYGDSAIAEMYTNGRGVEQNYSEAMQWYLNGADEDSAVAYFGIASLYANGIGRSEDVQIARTWYQKAADKDLKSAKDALASLDDSLHASLRMSYSSGCQIIRHEPDDQTKLPHFNKQEWTAPMIDAGSGNTELGPSCPGSSVEVLSPSTQEIDLLPYLNTVIKNLQYYWYRQIPREACPPVSKTGELVFSLIIQKDGKRAGGKLLASYGIELSVDDRPLLLAAGNSIASANPFPPLPAEFAKPSLSLHVHFRYNPNPMPSLDAYQDSLRTYPPAPVKIVAGSTQQFSTNVIEPESLGLTWTIVGSNCLGSLSCGTMSSSGLYTAPNKVPNPPDVTIAVNAPCRSASSKVTVIQLPGPAK